VLIPDADTKGVPVILDLASGEMLVPPDGRGNEPLFYFARLGRGDVGFDRVIFILRGGKLLSMDGKPLAPKEVKADATAYDLMPLSGEVVVKTGDGRTFRLELLGVDSEGGLRIRYAPMAAPAVTDQKNRAPDQPYGPAATAEAFMAAVAAGNDRDAMQMADPASAVPHQIADFHNLSNLKSLRLAQMHADDSSAMGATIPFEVEQRGKKETVVLQLTLTKSRGLWVVSDIDLKTPEIAKQSLDEFLAAHPKADVAWPPPPVSPAPDTKDLTEQVKAWVEDFFRHNYKDITRRETIEWGQAEALADGNLSIRYKYLATIRDKDKQVIEEVFTFAPDGKFVSVKKLGAAPAVTAAQIDWIQTACRRAEEFLASLRQGKPAEAYAHTTQEYRRGHEGGLERLAELMDLSKAKPVQVCVAMEAACVVVSPVSPVFPKGRDTSLGLGMIRVGENYLIRDIDLLPVDKAVKRFVDGFRSAYPAATGSYRPGPEPEPSSSSDRSPPAEANPSSER